MPQAKTPPAWRVVFLRELARCGSVALAAATCGIDRTSAYTTRRRNPAFALSWERALTSARARLGGATPERTSRQPRLAPDQFIRTSKSGKVCVARAGPGRWSQRKEGEFLTRLAATANISAAAEAVGLSTTSAYNHRRKWPAFAQAWRAAVAEGYDRVEAHLICQASCALDPQPPEVPSGPVEVSFDQGLNLLKLHRAAVRGGRPQRYAWRAQEPDIEEVRAEVIRRLRVMDRANGESFGLLDSVSCLCTQSVIGTHDGKCNPSSRCNQLR